MVATRDKITRGRREGAHGFTNVHWLNLDKMLLATTADFGSLRLCVKTTGKDTYRRCSRKDAKPQRSQELKMTTTHRRPLILPLL